MYMCDNTASFPLVLFIIYIQYQSAIISTSLTLQITSYIRYHNTLTTMLFASYYLTPQFPKCNSYYTPHITAFLTTTVPIIHQIPQYPHHNAASIIYQTSQEHYINTTQITHHHHATHTIYQTLQFPQCYMYFHSLPQTCSLRRYPHYASDTTVPSPQCYSNNISDTTASQPQSHSHIHLTLQYSYHTLQVYSVIIVIIIGILPSPM